jgi:DNA-binding winged helix-turn-helix (wHTH) protein
MRMRFGTFVLDYGARQLVRGSRPVHLTPKALDLLQLLVERRPAALSKAEIHNRLWPNTFVAEVNLPVLVHELRRALKDDPHDPHFLRTVAGFGYAFCSRARPEPESPEWATTCPFEYRLIWGVREIALQPGDNLLGRTHDATVWVDHSSVSRRHALLRVTEEGVTIEDCGSRNGTFVGGNRISEPTALRDGDHMLLGSTLLVFRSFARDGMSTAADGHLPKAEPPTQVRAKPRSTRAPTSDQREPRRPEAI